MPPVFTSKNSVLLFALKKEEKQLALEGKLKHITKFAIKNAIVRNEMLEPIINTNVINEFELALHDKRHYENIYNKGVCPLIINPEIKYAVIRTDNKNKDSYAVYKISTRRFVVYKIEDTPALYRVGEYGYLTMDPNGLYCDWCIEYYLQEMVKSCH